jgi:hypothetical protein
VEVLVKMLIRQNLFRLVKILNLMLFWLVLFSPVGTTAVAASFMATDQQYQEAKAHIKNLIGKDSCDWNKIEREEYRELTVFYQVDNRLSVVGFLCDHGAYMPHIRWFFRIGQNEVHYEQAVFARPFVQEGSDSISGIGTVNVLGLSSYHLQSKQLTDTRWYAAGDISETAIYVLDYRPEYSVRRFVLKSFNADTKRSTREDNIIVNFNN